MYFVYIIQCKDKSLYTGITNDLARRWKEHKEGKASHYTHAKGVKKMLYNEQLPDRSSALKREAAIKKLPRAKKLKLIISARQM